MISISNYDNCVDSLCVYDTHILWIETWDALTKSKKVLKLSKDMIGSSQIRISWA